MLIPNNCDTEILIKTPNRGGISILNAALLYNRYKNPNNAANNNGIIGSIFFLHWKRVWDTSF